MGLWSPWNRVMMLLAGTSVLAACYAVAAWGQVGDGQQQVGRQRPSLTGDLLSGSPTVTVAGLQVPAQAWRHFQRAKHAADHHRDAEFQRESARALEIAPRFASMYLFRATVEVGQRHYPAAVASVQAAIEVDPGAMWTAVVLAGAYNGMHRFNDALLVLKAKRGLEAESWQAMYERARAETGLGDADAAVLWSGKALAAAPQWFIDAHLVRANALLLDGRLDEATAQMDLYLHSKTPQPHRAEVVALLDAVRSRTDAAMETKAAPQGQLASR
jgi:tetratricopeptide (TPR) repeat protein